MNQQVCVTWLWFDIRVVLVLAYACMFAAKGVVLVLNYANMFAAKLGVAMLEIHKEGSLSKYESCSAQQSRGTDEVP